jgi:putative ABC transport system substrate-binding protein
LAQGIDTLVAEMRRLGYEEGRNLVLDWRLVETADLNDVLAADLVSLKPDLLVGAGSQQVYALKRATPSIPIDFVNTSDPVVSGLLTAWSAPEQTSPPLAEGRRL